MRAVPRSHLNGVLAHGVSKEKGNLLSVNQEVALSKEEENEAVDFVLKAGEISLHDGRLVPRQPAQPLEPPAVRNDAALHLARRPPDGSQLAWARLEGRPRPRRRSIRPIGTSKTPPFHRRR